MGVFPGLSESPLFSPEHPRSVVTSIIPVPPVPRVASGVTEVLGIFPDMTEVPGIFPDMTEVLGIFPDMTEVLEIFLGESGVLSDESWLPPSELSVSSSPGRFSTPLEDIIIIPRKSAFMTSGACQISNG
jgi:hypothetical protein